MTTRRRLAAPELDELLDRLPPDVRTALRTMHPGRGDQLDAAQADAVALVELALDASAGWVPRTEVDGWIRLTALDTLIAWIGGDGRTCMHDPDHRRPEPVFSCAWKPRLVVCMQCTHLLEAVGDADKVCDRCGHVCEGVEAGDPIYGGAVCLGAMVYEYGTCGDCRSMAQGAA
jgi:hypothetical protein